MCNIKPSRVTKIFTDEVATDFFETLKRANLRYLTVNSTEWEVSNNNPTAPDFITEAMQT